MSKFDTMRGLALAASGALALLIPVAPAVASIETVEAKAEASDAAAMARFHMEEVFGDRQPKPGQYLWRKGSFDGEPRLVIGLTDQRAYFYRGDALVAVAAISTGTEKHPTPKGIFTILAKQPMHRSLKYENAPMPFMQQIDSYGISMHAGHNPGYPASHGCIRLPAEFAKRLYGITGLGATVMIGA
jgi:hypothetical protein